MERIKGSPAYARFDGAAVFAHQMNAYEFIASLQRAGQSDARIREALRLLAINPIEAETDDLFQAAAFRAANAAKRVSYVDALGYVLATKHDLLFLTGDKAFRGLENVEYVA